MPVPLKSDPPNTDRVGTIVGGKYDVCQRIASGGVGTVYRARHRFTGRQVALKLLHEQFSRDKAMSERFLREAKAAAEIGHPNIVDVVDAGVDDVVGVYVAFELLEGFDLAEALKQKKLSIKEIVDVVDAVLDALHAAHQAGIIHRDVKPPNIFLMPRDNGSLDVRVLDFGAAKRQQVSAEESLTTLGTIIGTPAYMSPEQASGQLVDPRTDVWSMGAVLFRALAERPPFTEKNPNLLLACIIRDTAPSLAGFRPDLHPDLIAIVDRALARDPMARWQSAQQMREALQLAWQHACEIGVTRGSQPTVPMDRGTLQAMELPDTTVADGAPAGPSRRRRLLALGALMAALSGVALAFALTRAPRTMPTPAAAASIPTTQSSAEVVSSAASSQAPSAPVSVAVSASSSAGPGATAAQHPTVAAPLQKTPKAAPASKQRPPVVPIREYE